jgi:hypothetical protein
MPPSLGAGTRRARRGPARHRRDGRAVSARCLRETAGHDRSGLPHRDRTGVYVQSSTPGCRREPGRVVRMPRLGQPPRTRASSDRGWPHRALATAAPHPGMATGFGVRPDRAVPIRCLREGPLPDDAPEAARTCAPDPMLAGAADEAAPAVVGGLNPSRGSFAWPGDDGGCGIVPAGPRARLQGASLAWPGDGGGCRHDSGASRAEWVRSRRMGLMKVAYVIRKPAPAARG